jgi:hypothetical protein
MILPALSVLLISALPARTKAQSGPQTFQFTYPVMEIRTNPCNGEEVQLTGEGHIVTRFFMDSSGGIHDLELDHTLGALKGVGLTSGVAYQAQESQTLITNGQGAPFELSFSIDETLIAQGNVPNFIAHTTVHVTVNANGFPTADVLNMNTKCGG